MSVRVMCACGTSYELKDEYAGRLLACPQCGRENRVPAALSMAMSPGPSVGASGAIFGLLGAVVMVLYRHRGRFHLRDKRIGVGLAALAAFQVVLGFLTPFVDTYAHLGGLAGGGLAALWLRPRLLSAGR